MSQSLAAAKKRRAPNEAPAPIASAQQPNQQNMQSGGLTLPQVIQIVDRRLIHLEKFMNETKSKITEETPEEDGSRSIPSSEIALQLKDVVEEFDKRYEMLAEEIVNLKNIVISLQSFTMEVNKTMVEERRQLLTQFSTLGEKVSPPSIASSVFHFTSNEEDIQN